jgi:hypothetical protein
MNQQLIDLVMQMDQNFGQLELLPLGAPPNGVWMRKAMEGILNGDHPDYIGMGNPDADILLVGREKALDPANPLYWPIIAHELLLNHAHWRDIVLHHRAVPRRDVALLRRAQPFTGFSPYNPLLFPLTWQLVSARGAHTYRRMWLAVNEGALPPQVAGLAQMDQAAREAWQWMLFDKVFITELNMKVALNAAKAQFDLRKWLGGPRHQFMAGLAAPFYQRFKTVVIYAGVNNRRYVGAPGTPQRLALVKLFNPTLTHADLVVLHPLGLHVEQYANEHGARVLLTPSLFMHVGVDSALAIQQLLYP